jgi:hypothetical protein
MLLIPTFFLFFKFYCLFQKKILSWFLSRNSEKIMQMIIDSQPVHPFDLSISRPREHNAINRPCIFLCQIMKVRGFHTEIFDIPFFVVSKQQLIFLFVGCCCFLARGSARTGCCCWWFQGYYVVVCF